MPGGPTYETFEGIAILPGFPESNKKVTNLAWCFSFVILDFSPELVFGIALLLLFGLWVDFWSVDDPSLVTKLNILLVVVLLFGIWNLLKHKGTVKTVLLSTILPRLVIIKRSFTCFSKD